MDANPQLSMSGLRLICAALIAGQLIFAGIVAFLVHGTDGGGLGEADFEILGMVAAGLAVVAVPAAFLLRGMRFGQISGLEADARLQGYSATVILFFAILEGPGLLNIVAWMLTGEAIPSAPIVALLIAIGLASFPSMTQLENLGK